MILALILLYSCEDNKIENYENESKVTSSVHNYSQDWENFKEAVLTRNKQTVITFVSNEDKTLKLVIEIKYDFIFDDVFIDKISKLNYSSLKDDEYNGKPCKSFMVVYYKNDMKVEKGNYFYFEESPIGLRMINFVEN
jgi:hypothetical protein